MESFWIIILLQAVIFGIFCSFIAKEKGRDGGNWFFLGFFFSFLAILALMAVPKEEIKSLIENKQVNGQTPSSKAICPFCREEINPEATLCKHCRSDLTEKKPIIINNQKVTENVLSNATKKVKCPNCDFSEDIPLSKIYYSNEAFHDFESHLDSRWEPYLKCPKCHKKFVFQPRKIKPD